MGVTRNGDDLVDLAVIATDRLEVELRDDDDVLRLLHVLADSVFLDGGDDLLFDLGQNDIPVAIFEDF